MSSSTVPSVYNEALPGVYGNGNKAIYFRGTREQKSKTEGNRGTKAILGNFTVLRVYYTISCVSFCEDLLRSVPRLSADYTHQMTSSQNFTSSSKHAQKELVKNFRKEARLVSRQPDLLKKNCREIL